MNFLPHWAQAWTKVDGQKLLLAILMLTASIFSWWDKRRREQREEAREEKRKLEDEAREEARKIEMAAYRAEEDARQKELAKNLVISQELVETHAALLKKDLEDLKLVNVQAIETANGYNEKIATLAEMVASTPVVQQVEIVQPVGSPVPVHNVEEGG